MKRSESRTQSDPQTKRNKKALAGVIAQKITDEQMTQREASERMREHQSQVSLIVSGAKSGELDGFSEPRLMYNAAKLGFDITIVVSKSAGKSGKVTVVQK